MHPRIEELFAYSNETRAELTRIAAGISDHEMMRKAADGGWSVAEHLEHLAMVETGASRLAQKLFAKAKAAGLPPETQTSSVLRSLDTFGLADNKFSIEAPGFVVPQGAKSPSESLAQIEAARLATLEVLREGDGLDLTGIKFQHATLGELDLYQWLLFLAQHERRHARHIERVVHGLREQDAVRAPADDLADH